MFVLIHRGKSQVAFYANRPKLVVCQLGDLHCWFPSLLDRVTILELLNWAPRKYITCKCNKTLLADPFDHSTVSWKHEDIQVEERQSQRLQLFSKVCNTQQQLVCVPLELSSPSFLMFGMPLTQQWLEFYILTGCCSQRRRQSKFRPQYSWCISIGICLDKEGISVAVLPACLATTSSHRSD